MAHSAHRARAAGASAGAGMLAFLFVDDAFCHYRNKNHCDNGDYNVRQPHKLSPFQKFLKILKKLFSKSFFSGVWGNAPI